jgi:uncharacterized protein (DUF488 family)
MRPRTIVSIGYQGRTPVQLIAILRQHGVRKVLDVRELPRSRKKGFSRTALSQSLAEAGISYRHLRAAGNPYRRLKADVRRCLALYSRHLARHPEITASVAAAIGRDRVAVLCFERAHEACHRSRLISSIARRPGRWDVIRLE